MSHRTSQIQWCVKKLRYAATANRVSGNGR